jgi:DNA polymerase
MAPSLLALRALADFWTDMGLEEARALRTWRPPGAAAPRAAAPTRAPAIARTPDMPAAPRGAPRKLNNNPINDARRLAAQATSLAELRAIVEQYDGCPLKKAAKTTVVCDGAYAAEIMIVGEAPGAEEDARGLPFVGRAGQLLDRMLASIGLSRQESVYITNLIYWRPPGNRDPSPVEMQMCAPFLLRQIELKQPKLLLTAGKFATSAMLGKDDGIDMLDLDGDHVDQLGELADLDGICERARHRLAAHGAHRRVQAARIQRRHDHAEARGGLCHHAAQLAATEAAHVALIRENIDGLHR